LIGQTVKPFQLSAGSSTVQAGTSAVNEVNEDPDAEKPLLRGPDWTIKAWKKGEALFGLEGEREKINGWYK
jgi:hypothetical protein